MTTVTWTQDVNSNYEVSSPEHMKQLMHKGGLYTDAGSSPVNYWAAGTNYIQTADRLYADTGSGYVLTEESITTTL